MSCHLSLRLAHLPRWPALLLSGLMSAPPAFSAPVTWAPSLALDRLDHAPSQLRKPFGETITLQKDGQTVGAGDCVHLLDARAAGYDTWDRAERLEEKSVEAQCVALRVLSNARPARRSGLAGFKLGAGSLMLLPPTVAASFSTIEAQKAAAAEADGKSLAQFTQDVAYDHVLGVEMRGKALLITTSAWASNITILAQGDFDGDGQDDLLIELDERATEGEFRNTRLLILTRSTDGGLLRTVRQLM